jgi:hypothetical protein
VDRRRGRRPPGRGVRGAAGGLKAAGTPFDADEPTLTFLADLAARTVPGGLSRRGRARPGATILLHLGSRQWLLGGGAGERPDPGAAADLAATLSSVQ